MTTDKLIDVITPVLASCSFTCKLNGGRIELFDKKKTLAGTVSADGEVQEKRAGKQNLLGALLKRKLVEAIEAAQAPSA